MAPRFTILGPVEVWSGDRRLEGAAPRHRAVWGYLLLNARTVISAERLIDAVWGLTPPDTARAQIHAAITAIRRVLREAGAEHVLQTRPAGYVALPEPGGLDLERFGSQVAAAQKQDPHGAVRDLKEALALWRGVPFADVNADYVPAARTRLQERRLTVVERLADLELSLGRHAELIDELTAQVAAHPLRERLSCLLMLALYRSGRQPDALSAARTFRTALVEEQGLDPGKAFTDLEQAILRSDESLDLAVPEAAAPARRRVNFLPYDTPDFAGRAEELDRLTGPSPGTGGVVTISAIDGMAGIGKTTLAVHAGHRCADRFPDGQLFVDLQAHTAGRTPVAPGIALEVLLRQLGVPAERIPAETTDRAALWRAELCDRRVVAVLDNAASTDHVRPLLPGASASLLLITSRNRLVDLDGARALSVDVLPAADAVDLFRTIVGERADAEPLAVMDVLQLCGFLPLAVRIAAARLRHRRQWTVQYLAGRLRDQRRRLAELSTADRGVAAAFALSYQQLDAERQRMFRLLGLHPGRDIDIHAAAALADLPPDRSEAILEDLLDAHVLAQQQPGRYTFHDLLRTHARDTALTEETTEARQQALTRLFDHYLRTARQAVDQLYPYIEHRMPPHDAHAPGEAFADAAQAAEWLEAELANLVAAGAYAADHDWPGHTSLLAMTLYHYLDRRAYLTDAATLHTQAIHASRRRGDKAAESRALIDLSEVAWRRGDYEQAGRHAEQALALSSEIGDRLGEALARNRIGYVCWRQRDYDQAHEHYRRALDLCREIGYRFGIAAGLDNLGTVYARQGHYAQAVEHIQQSLDLCREIGSPAGEVDALDNLGLALRRQGRLEQARDHHRQALTLCRRLGYRSDEAEALNGLGEVARALSDPAQAVGDHRAALTLAVEVGNSPEQARAHDGLARAHHELGDTGLARDHAKQARDLYVGLDVPEGDEARALLAALERDV